jgi:hypothetical protein
VLLRSAALVAAVAAAGPPAGAQAATACRPADGLAAALVSSTKLLLAAPDAASAGLRARLGLSGVAASSVALVSDERTCRSAIAALQQLFGIPNAAFRVYVVKAGTNRYVVTDPAVRGGEHMPRTVFDKQFKYVGTLL